MGLLDAEALVELLGAAEHNHSIIANNLANVNTPGYRTARMRFREELDSLLGENGRLRPGARIESEVYWPTYRATSADGNDVLLEREIVELNKNVLRMRIYLAALSKRISKLRSAIQGR
jgi:flagellar basal-body rod protein FlgB